MSQIWKGDIAVPVSLLKLKDGGQLDLFKENDLVKVVGTTKGKGFQGVVKRHNFRGGPKSHGQKDRLRAPGSIGNTDLQRVAPGRRMAGRMGGNKKTIRNLKVVEVDKEKTLLFVQGSVPGNNGGKLTIIKT